MLGVGRNTASARMNMSACATLLIAIALHALPLMAQDAELSGLITDPAGLAVPSARVVVQSADTGATRTVSSNQTGEYSEPAMLPGPYNITIDANGFQLSMSMASWSKWTNARGWILRSRLVATQKR
jgi:hypothetical protein